MMRGGAWLLVLLVGIGCATSPEQLDRPTNVAFGLDGDVYVADGYNHARIARFSESGEFLMEWGEKGFGRGQFDTPHGVVTDDEGRVYVADRENARVQVFDADGRYLSQWKSAALGRPWVITFGPDRHVYVVDGGTRIRSGREGMCCGSISMGRSWTAGARPATAPGRSIGGTGSRWGRTEACT
ncbi:hypothetical protein ACMHYB_17495 [Sorangium sp. So ce1128]